MKLGVATRQGIRGVPETPYRGLAPDILTQWISLLPGGYSPTTYRPVDPRPTPLIYLESHLDAAGYERLLAGEYDAQLASLRKSLPTNAIVRWDHEMTSPANDWRTWGAMDPALYAQGFRHVAIKLGKTLWCPMAGPDQLSRWADYYPGDTYVDFVGFDFYDLALRRPLPQSLAKYLDRLREIAPGKPILIGELGSNRSRPVGRPSVKGRAKWLRSLADVDIWGAVYFDIDRPTEGHDWRMGPAMLRTFERLQEGR